MFVDFSTIVALDQALYRALDLDKIIAFFFSWLIVWDHSLLTFDFGINSLFLDQITLQQSVV